MYNSKCTITKRKSADTEIWSPALCLSTAADRVFVIGGYKSIYMGENESKTVFLSSVSSFNIARNTWQSGLPELRYPRHSASACVLKGMVYVFCGLFSDYYYF